MKQNFNKHFYSIPDKLRPSSSPEKKKKRLFEEIIVDGVPLSRNKLKKMRRNPRLDFSVEKPQRFDICNNCTNTKVFLCISYYHILLHLISCLYSTCTQSVLILFKKYTCAEKPIKYKPYLGHFNYLFLCVWLQCNEWNS